MIYRFCRKIFRWPVCLCLIAGVITHAGANDDSHNSFPDIRSKISPLLRAEIYRNEMKMMLGKNSTDQGEHAGEYADVLIHVQPGVLPEDIGRQTLTCGIAAARVPVGRLRSLAACSGILRIEPSVTARPLLDVSVPELGADEVWSGSAGLPLAGENVIIGIYDSGIDWSHPDFIREDNTSRILAVWDRTDESGTPPSGYSTGSEYSREQIDRELNGTLQGVVQGLDTDGHGTHVAGIAGGNGRGTGYGQQAGVYCGVAPESDLIIVKDNQFLEGSILEAVDYIFKKADALCPGRPVVVNISVGGIHAGPHDGTATLEKNLSDYLDEPGRAIVIAAGNDGNRDIHFQTSVGSAGDSTSVSFQIESNPPASNDLFTLNIWYPPQAGLAVTLKSPSGVRYGPVFGGSERYWPSGGVPMVYISNATEAHTNGDFNILIQLTDSENNGQGNAFPEGGWTVIFSGMPGRIDGWIVDALSSVQGRWTSHVDRSVTLAEPANARLCITAGAYVSRTDWPSLYADPWGPDDLETGELSLFSSAGPARPNTKGSSSPNKPEIAAPGEYIVSSLSSQVYPPPENIWIATDGVHVARKGTSMAAPHVAGVIALMFQADPEMNISDIKLKLIQSARKDEYTGTGWFWDQSWGYGKLDALNAVRRVTAVADDFEGRNPGEFGLGMNYPNPFNGFTVIPFSLRHACTVTLSVYDPAGRLVCNLAEGLMAQGCHEAVWNGLDRNGRAVASGVYLVRLTVDEQMRSNKITFLK